MRVVVIFPSNSAGKQICIFVKIWNNLNWERLTEDTGNCFTYFITFRQSQCSHTTLCKESITWKNVWPSDQPHQNKSWWCVSSHLCVPFLLSSDQLGDSTLHPPCSSYHMNNFCHGVDHCLLTKKTTFVQVSDQIPCWDRSIHKNVFCLFVYFFCLF